MSEAMCDHPGVAAGSRCPACGEVAGEAPLGATMLQPGFDAPASEAGEAPPGATLAQDGPAPAGEAPLGATLAQDGPGGSAPLGATLLQEHPVGPEGPPEGLGATMLQPALEAGTPGIGSTLLQDGPGGAPGEGLGATMLQPGSGTPPTEGLGATMLQAGGGSPPPSGDSGVRPGSSPSHESGVRESSGILRSSRASQRLARDSQRLDASKLSESGVAPSSSSGLKSSRSVHTGAMAEGKDIAGKFFNKGKYEILGEIARGGMGCVYRARQTDLNRIVALKVMLAGNQAGEAEKIRFIREAEASAKLKHPNIVPVYDIGEDEGNLYFTMDYVEGAPLSKKKEEYDRKKLLEVMIKVCDGVAYAHMRGIIHRDLKPANVMVEKNDNPLIMDFGLAKQLEEAESTTDSQGNVDLKTREGALMGTPHYMSPEQAGGMISEIDVRSDVWALGVMLYELWTKKLPFNAKNVRGLMKAIQEEEPARPRTVDPSIPWDVEAIILKTLEKEKAKRYDSAMELKRDLERFRDGQPILAAKATLAYRAQRWVQRNRVPVAVGACFFAVLVAAGSFAWTEATKARRDRAAQVAKRLKEAHELEAASNAAVQGFGKLVDELEKLPSGDERLARAESASATRADAQKASGNFRAGAQSVLSLDPDNADGRELGARATGDADKLAAAMKDHDQLLVLERAARESRKTLAEKTTAARQRLAAAKAARAKGDLDAAAAAVREGQSDALAAVALGGEDEGEQLAKDLVALNAEVESARQNKAAFDAARKAIAAGEAALADARKLLEAEPDRSRAAARKAAQELATALGVADVRPQAEADLREAHVITARALIRLKRFGLAQEEIDGLGTTADDAKARAALAAELATAQGESERLQKRLAELQDAVDAAARAGTAEAALAVAEDAKALAASGKLLPEQQKDAQAIERRASFLRLRALAQAAQKRASAFQEGAEKPEVAAGLWEEAAKAYEQAATFTVERTGILEEARRCRLELGSVRVAAARALRSRDPAGAALQARRASELFASLGADDRRAEARALFEELERLSGRPEGMLLWKGIEKAELGGGPEDRNPVRIEAVPAFYIARKETTSQEFYDAFVSKGGYAKDDLWRGLFPDLDAAARARFVDRDGKPGPAFWRDGRPPEGEGALPVAGISYYEARAFAAFVGKRLPTDAEWEAVARLDPDGKAPPRTFPLGDRLDDVARVLRGDVLPVGPEGASPEDRSPLGCVDMTGNVSEWVELDPRGLSPEQARGRGSVRGASFLTPYAALARATHRFLPKKDVRSPAVGVRLAQDLPQHASQPAEGKR